VQLTGDVPISHRKRICGRNNRRTVLLVVPGHVTEPTPLSIVHEVSTFVPCVATAVSVALAPGAMRTASVTDYTMVGMSHMQTSGNTNAILLMHVSTRAIIITFLFCLKRICIL